MSVEIRRASARFVERAPGRATAHAFSFGEYYDPERLGFGPLVCHDQHLLASGQGFDLHRHCDLEIVTYVVSGSLVHNDASGTTTVVPAGSVAHLSTGSTETGVEHGEHASPDGACRFVQMWLRPGESGESRESGESGESGPAYDVAKAALVADEAVAIAQPRPDAVLWAIELTTGGTVDLPVADQVHAYVATGALTRSSLAEPLVAGDAFLMSDEPARTVTAAVPSLLLVWAFS